MAIPPKALIDLNILLDVMQKREPFLAASAQVLAAAEKGEIQAYLAAQTITTLFYLVAKDQSADKARTLIREILVFFKVAAVTQSTIETAITLPMSDFEDAVQLAAALEIQAGYLITRNIKDYPDTSIPVMAPAEFLTLLT